MEKLQNGEHSMLPVVLFSVSGWLEDVHECNHVKDVHDVTTSDDDDTKWRFMKSWQLVKLVIEFFWNYVLL